MRFAALQGSSANDYAVAGKLGGDALADSFATTRKYGPEYGEIAKTGIKARSAERVASMQAGAQVAKAGINAVAQVQKVHTNERAKEEVRNIKSKSRKAGGIAALGKVAAAGFLMRDNDKRKPPSNLDAKKDLIAKWQKDRDAKTAARDAARTDYVPPADLEAPDIPKPGNVDTGNTPSSNADVSSPSDDTSTPAISSPTTKPIGGTAGKADSPASPTSVGYDGTFGSVYNMAKAANARYPELVAAQWQLESAGGTAISGKNNFFGIKAGANESGTSKGTWEEANGQAYNTSARFKNFESPQDSVNELVSRWHQDYQGYSGVNNSASASDAAHSLREQGYATDSKYATKLIDIMRRNGY